jgi:hypothetical protein
MAVQKKTSSHKGATRKKAAKATAPKSAPAATVAARTAAPARKAATRRSKAATPPTEQIGIASLFDVQLPQEMRAAIEAAESVSPMAASLTLPDSVAAPAAQLLEAGAAQARQTFKQARTTSESLRQAMAETAQATTLGALEVNAKVMEALQAQSDAALDLWRTALQANSLSDAISLQTSGARQVYETASSHWADVAESARRWFGATVKPLQAPWSEPSR